jgi:hypothetical protein
LHTSIRIAGSLNELTQPPETVPYHLGASGYLLAILSPREINAMTLLRARCSGARSKLIDHYNGASLSLNHLWHKTNACHYIRIFMLHIQEGKTELLSYRNGLKCEDDNLFS